MDDRTIVTTSAPSRAGIGTRLNDLYQIDELIAVGGMGEVYRGHVIETGDVVAIKTIRPDFAENAQALAMFRKEAAALLNVHHGAVVRYFVFSIDRRLDLPYLAMEYVTGGSLAEALKQGPLPYESLDVLRRRLASGLQAAHEAGIVHRDVSPDNVILPAGDVARAKIIDFGIAREPVGGQTVIGNGFAGKYAYVSPEQFGLQGGVVTARSDIYSLGLVLAEAALGRPLDMGGSPAEFIARRSTVPDLTEIDARIAPLFEAMLRPDPRMRPESMAEVAAWTAPSASTRPIRPEPAKRSPRGLILGALGAVTVVAVGVTAMTLRGLSPEPAGPDASPPLAERVPQTEPAPEKPAGPPPAPELPPASAPGTGPSSGQAPDGPAEASPPPQPPPQPPRGRDPAGVPPGRPAPADPAKDPPHDLPKDSPKDVGKDVAKDLTKDFPKDAPKALPKDAPPASPTPERVAAYIRGYQGGPCFFLNPASVSPREAVIEAYGTAPEPFAAFDAAFRAALGFEANIQLRQIDAAQCPVVDVLAQQAQSKPSSVPRLRLDADRIRSGEELRGTIDLADDRPLQLLLVDDEGRVHDLAPYLKRTGRQARFAMRLEVPASGRARGQLLVAVATQGAPAAVGANARSREVFPPMAAEAARSSTGLGLAVRYVKVGG